MDTKWKNMVKAIKKFIKEYYDCVFGFLLFIIGSFLFFEVLVNRYYYSTWGVWRICLIGNILVQPGICLLVRRYMKLRYRNWSQKGSAETYLQDTEDSIYYQTWKAKEKQSEKRFRNILAVELSAAAAYLFFISYSSGWGWNYAAGYMMVATVFIEYICCREVIQRYWRNELDQIMEQTESFFQKRLEQALEIERKSLEKVSRSDQLRVDLITNVSHDLKTPLTSISGFAEIMQGGLVKNEDIPKFAGRIYKESQRLLQLVEDVIQISQLDEEKTSYTWELVDVYQVCKNAFESLKEKAQSMNVHLYICGDSMKMEAVRTLLEEAVYNVCDNAIKYNRNDGSVSVFLTQTAQEIQIVVKDTGVGIPKEDQNRVFERFYRVDKSHSKEIGGTGLGLSIVKHAVGALKGSVILRSEEGNGTEICMKFPKVHKE